MIVQGDRVENFRADQCGRVEGTIVEQLRAEQSSAEQDREETVSALLCRVEKVIAGQSIVSGKYMV